MAHNYHRSLCFFFWIFFPNSARFFAKGTLDSLLIFSLIIDLPIQLLCFIAFSNSKGFSFALLNLDQNE
jgi:hypothetical protein